MRVIVSTTIGDNFINYKVVKSLTEVIKLCDGDNANNVTTLIYHSSEQSDFDVGVLFAKLRNSGIKRFIYINEHPISMVRMVIDGINPHCIFEDEFYLEDEEELNALLEEIGVAEEEETSLISVNIIKDFIQSFVRDEERIKSKAYLTQVSNAIDDLAETTKIQSLQITTMGNSAIEIFERAGTLIRKMNDNKKVLEDKLQALQADHDNAPSSNGFGDSIQFFAPYNYMGNGKILVIREAYPTRFLTSFVLGYQNHLHMEMNKLAKLIFVVGKEPGIMSKYKEFVQITDQSMNISALYDEPIVVTNVPKKEVMRDLLTKSNEVYIVVDRLYGNNAIVKGRVNTIDVVSSLSDIDRYKLNPENCIACMAKRPDLFGTLKTIKDYPIEVDSRQAAYLQVFEDLYAKLDRLIKVVVEYY